MTVYVIAEAGVNHNGDVSRALALIDIAADAGADAVKFQTFRPEELVAPDTPKAAYQMTTTGAAGSQLEMLRSLALLPEDFRRLRDRCRARGIDFLSSPFDIDSLDFLVDQLDMKSIKIASGEIVNGPLLLRAARKHRPIFLSTGMSTLADIERALDVIAFGLLNAAGDPTTRARLSPEGKAALADKVTLLHCTSEYPAPLSAVNLRVIATLRETFGLPCGFSDHSLGITAPIAAAALGATVMEKHITSDRKLPGPDHRASLEPDELAEMVRRIREVSQSLGRPEKQVTEVEFETAKVARRVLVALRPIAKGTEFTSANLGCRRAVGAKSPMDYWKLIGSPAPRNYGAGEPIEE
jgi:N-acetylneuraminate synthase